MSSYINKDRVNIALSVGGTKIGAGAVNSEGKVVAKIKEVPSNDESMPLFDSIVAQIAKVAAKVGRQNIIGIGISFPECVYPPKRFVADPENIPPTKDPIQERIEDMVYAKLGTTFEIEVVHDAAAAALGEISPGGTLPFCKNCVFVVWGTGIASGIINSGKLYWRDPVIDRMTGEIGHLVIRNAEGIYEYRLCPRWMKLKHPEESVDHRICGPSLIKRFSRRIKEDSRGEILLELVDKSIDDLELVDINAGARDENELAIELIEEAGKEMGEALAPFIYYWREIRKKNFVDNIIIGSGVAKIGKEIRRKGKKILITAIRSRIIEGLARLNMNNYDANNIIISEIGYEREFLAFIPD